jgi:hypothetical protein
MAAWVAMVAFVSFVIPHFMIERFDPPAFKWAWGAPRPPQWQFDWRNFSLLILFVAAMVSFPKWKGWVPLAIAIALIAYSSYGV